ncbi:CoA transferase [Jatrophihabitans cynanchi]|jgi:formyl-CoA transferase|uniref:CoA transferase n=1 Tax=Jatrophihabitans cynanchi TaxID=2944128 RepID=A0ABY7JUV9_9ACTN|nr:CaiB/BaiF CoA-transferase family protein [Jatrophihabitans sp. SB3-54]WAX56318.1 CoA transferase [Jatrophihabitans sp. SB3-54]
MRLGEIRNAEALASGKPLDGVRVLALEQLQALPFATQLLARLGADVVKVEKPGTGESGRGSLPAMTDPAGRQVGATFLRNNLGKRSVAIDITRDAGRQLVLELVPHFDVVAENFRPGVLDRLGLGYDDVRSIDPRSVYLSVSGFGNTQPSPYRDRPAYAPVPEAMSGIYEMKRLPGAAPIPVPMGGVGDIGSALFAVIGVLAALRHREHTGRGQHVDVAMFDCMLSITDLVTNFWSMGLAEGQLAPHIMHGFRASDGWFIVMVIREYEFERLARRIGQDQWLTDPRLATRAGWIEHLETVVRPGIEQWAAGRTREQACAELGAAGVATAPCLRAGEVVTDPHVEAHDMLVEVDRTDGVAQPILVPGNPIKMTDVAIGPERRMPWLGEHTDEVLAAEIGLSAAELVRLRDAGVLG